MLLCGISDCLLSYMGDGEPHVLVGIISADIVNVPLWYYQASFVIGIIACVGYLLASRAACFTYSTGRTATERDCIRHFLLAQP